MKEEINFESIAKQYKCAVATKYRPLKPEEINLIPSGKIFVSKKIDGELWLAHIDKDGATLFAKGGRFIKEGKIPMINIKEIPKGSTKALGISGNVSPCWITGIKFLPIFLYLSKKNFWELLNLTSTIDLIASVKIPFELISSSILFLLEILILGIIKSGKVKFHFSEKTAPTIIESDSFKNNVFLIMQMRA